MLIVFPCCKKLCVTLLLFCTGYSFAEPLRIAAAANFSPVLNALQRDYQQSCAAPWQISSASSGQLHAQIQQGAPFAVFLAADEKSVDALPSVYKKATGIYALGKLALWFKNQHAEKVSWQNGELQLVLANPVTAPYGQVALQYLTSLNLNNRHYVRANNIQQAYVLVDQGAVAGGFVALSALLMQQRPAQEYIILEGSAELRQKAVLLVDNTASRCFWNWLYHPLTQQRIAGFGYGILP